MYGSQQELDTLLLWKALGFFVVSGFTGFYSLPSRTKLLSYTLIMLCLIIWLFIFPADVK